MRGLRTASGRCEDLYLQYAEYLIAQTSACAVESCLLLGAAQYRALPRSFLTDEPQYPKQHCNLYTLHPKQHCNIYEQHCNIYTLSNMPATADQYRYVRSTSRNQKSNASFSWLARQETRLEEATESKGWRMARSSCLVSPYNGGARG